MIKETQLEFNASKKDSILSNLKNNFTTKKRFVLMVFYVFISFFVFYYYNYYYNSAKIGNISLFDKISFTKDINKVSSQAKTTTKIFRQQIINLKTFKSKCECKSNKLIMLNKNGDDILVDLLDNNNTQTNLYRINEKELIKSNFTCDFYSVFRRGRSQKVIAYSLYGKNRIFYDKLQEISVVIKKLFPGWYMRVYHDDSIDESIKCQIECLRDENGQLVDNADFCSVNNLEFNLLDLEKNKLNKTKNFVALDVSYVHAAMWRWFPLGDNFVDVLSSRDSDSFIIQREIDSMKVWFDSNKPGHIMRDHPMHYTHILAGMWGFYNSRNRNIANEFFQTLIDVKKAEFYNFKDKNTKGYDQYFLLKEFYPKMKNISVIHDSYSCERFNDSTPFPTQRKGNCFIGFPKLRCNPKGFFSKCPIECRPKDHQDWETC